MTAELIPFPPQPRSEPVAASTPEQRFNIHRQAMLRAWNEMTEHMPPDPVRDADYIASVHSAMTQIAEVHRIIRSERP